MESLYYACVTPLAMAVVLILPPLIPAIRLTPRGGFSAVLLNALVLGAASQGLIGFLWNHAVSEHPGGAAAAHLGFWLVVSLVCLLRPRNGSPADTPRDAPPMEAAWCCSLLLAAVIVRMLHPLHSAALGQSDAYSHLLFIHQVVADGQIHNRIYPAAYSWIMALPSLPFGMDPYWIARFGGAFWGAALVLVLYRLGCISGGPAAGRIAAALAAFCPAWLPLMKTGVGSFANQVGLFLLPVIWIAYLMEEEGRERFAFLIIATLLVSAAVPMMLIAAVPILAADRILAVLIREPRRWRRTFLTMLALLPSAMLLFWQTGRIQGIHRVATVSIVTEGKANALEKHGNRHPSGHAARPGADHRVESSSGRVALRLLKDYLSVKRRGYGSGVMNAAGTGLAACFLGALLTGLRHRKTPLRFLGVWGLISSAQAASGVLQFSGYQREGWSLLIAVAWLGGITGAAVWNRFGRWLLLRAAYAIFFAACIILSLLFPPAHPLGFSAAENEIVETVRAHALRVERNEAEPPLTIVMRPFSLFQGDQGDILKAVIGPLRRVRTRAAGADFAWNPAPDRNRQYLFLMDRQSLAGVWQPGLFGRVQPEQSTHFLRSHEELFLLNDKVRNLVKEMSAAGWSKQTVCSTPALEAVRMVRQK